MALGRNPNREFEELKTQAARARLPYDKDVLLNLAFYLDQQYTEWVADASMIRQIPRRTNQQNQPRPVANKIMHFVLKQHAEVLEARPQVDVLPATDDPIDISMASVALAYLKWLSEPQVCDFEGELADAALWALTGGEAFLKWTFNPKLGRPDFMACSPLEIFLDPYAKKYKQCRYIIHEKFMDVAEAEDIYEKKVSPTTVSRADAQKAALLRDMGMAPILEGALINELWYKPCKKYPDGLFVVWSGKDLLHGPIPFPYKHKHLPFTQIGAVPRPGSPHYTCTVKFLRSPQMELNKYHAQRIQVRESFSNPKWWLPSELQLEHDPDDSPSQILRGHSNGGAVKPEIIQPSKFPENADGQWIREEMMDVAGQHEISQGRVPGRVEAAAAISILKASDVSHLNELKRTIKLSIAEGFWQTLMLAKQFVPSEQIVQVYSREGMPEVKRFKAEQLKPGMRVQVLMGTGLADSRAAKQDQAILMWDKGIIKDPEIMAELMEIPVGTITPQRVYDIRLARNENLLMAEGVGVDGSPGQAIKPNSWDSHDIHLREHNNFRKTAEYDQLDEEIKQKFEFHCDTHETLHIQQLQKEVQKQQLIAAALQGPVPQASEQVVPEEQVPQPADNAPDEGAPVGNVQTVNTGGGPQ